jgi:hypothetical protein
MHVAYGEFQFEPWEAGIGVSARVNRTPRKFKKSIDVRFDISGELCISGAQNITDRLSEIINAFAVDGKDIGLYHDDGSPTVHYLQSDHPFNMTGNQVLYTSFPQTEDGEYASGRKFQIAIGAEIIDAEQNLVEYNDSIQLVGNAGPVWAWPYNDTWGFQPEIISPTSMQRIIHTGEAVGMVNYITPPAPFYLPPFEDNTRRTVVWGSPRRTPQGFTEYVTRWQYTYRLPVADDFLRPTQR